MNPSSLIGVVGSGAMGSGIAQVAAAAGHSVVLYDNNPQALEKAAAQLTKVLHSLQEKGKIASAQDILDRITLAVDLDRFKDCDLIIEAIVENAAIKKDLFAALEGIVSDTCLLASNTSSLSITLIASACRKPERVLGIHFFNPAPLMPLVEIIPALQSDQATILRGRALIDQWGKCTVLAKDTPGFIVNRLARPFYGESIRIAEEGIADYATIDWALRETGGFRMGPFELMDFIGNDINYTVTETVFREFFYDPRYRPSFTQKRLVEAQRYGRKTGRGYYEYSEGAVKPEPKQDKALAEKIFSRVLVMLINEAAEALHLQIASREDLDLAMTKGVNYPKGLLRWADEYGIANCLTALEELHALYGDDRYRPSVLLRRMAANNATFY